jgi:acyl-CoA thioesterase II
VTVSAPSWIKTLLAFDRDGDVFCIREPERGAVERLFGGLIAAQSLGAAGATVDGDKVPQSLHAYFVRGGRYDAEVEFRVTRIRDGRAFATRQVSASQDGKVILEMIASFHAPEPGADWQPETAPVLEFDAAVPKTAVLDFDVFELRTRKVDDSEFAVPPFWIRTREPVEDDPLIRACTLAYMSDLGPVPTALPPSIPLRPDLGFATSLDHSIWFHRPFRPEVWHRYELQAVNHNDSRGLTTGSLLDESGALIASVSQEALWRITGS